MHNFLKRLELHGFKSFANKIVLEFPGRIIGVVGPNGSGKSNVVDAIRWVLGEREAKQLRGATLDNLIFAGTPKKTAMGFASVVLTFDNRNRELPFEAEEVAVARKIDRSGNSEFFVNDIEIKLKDLVPLLLRARLSSRGMLIVGQGESDIFVKSSPEERRFMIEEVLGLREFRIRKNQAERRLVASQINMEKAQAMIQEIAPHLKFLRRQKTRWEKRLETETALRALENNYFSLRYREFLDKQKEIEKPLSVLEANRKKQETEVMTLEKEIKSTNYDNKISQKIKEIKFRLDDLIGKKSHLEKEIAKMEAKREILSLTEETASHSASELTAIIKSLAADINDLINSNNLEEIKKVLAKWSHTLKELMRASKKDETELAHLNEIEEKKIKTAIENIVSQINLAREEENQLSDSERSANRNLREKFEKLEALKNILRKIENECLAVTFEKEKIALKINDLENQWKSIGREIKELREFTSANSAERDREELNLAEAEKKMLHLRGELAAIGEIDSALIKESEETENRYLFLEKELADLGVASMDLKTLIKELDEKIHNDFKKAFGKINEEFNKYFNLMFNGGKAKFKLKSHIQKEEIEELHGENEETKEIKEEIKHEEEEIFAGVEIDVSVPKKKITNLEMLSGGEKSLVSAAALFSLIAVSPPPFLVLDEMDAALDETNARRFAELVKEFSHKTQFIIITHNRYTMEVANILYGITMEGDGVSKVLSMKLDS